MTYRRTIILLTFSFMGFIFSFVVYLNRINDSSLIGLDRKNYQKKIPMGKIRGRLISADGKYITDFYVKYKVVQMNSKDNRDVLERKEVEEFLGRRLKIKEYKYLGYSEFLDLTDDEVLKLMKKKYKFKTLVFVPYAKRILRCKPCYHIIGHVSIDGRGLGGLERFYDKRLSGSFANIIMDVDAFGNVVSPFIVETNTKVKDIVLTLRYDLYELVDSLFSNYERGAVFMFNPKNGYVYLVYSKPSPFDSLKDAPMLNRALSGLYPPGSTFKPLVALLALKEGIIDTGFGVSCPGYIFVGGHRFRCWTKHGYVKFERAIALSCNVYFYNIGGRFGARRLLRSLLSTGLFDRKFTQLPEETPSRIRVRNFYLGTALNLAIGQGEVLVTPVFMAVLAGLIGNGGWVVLPRFSSYDSERVFRLEAPKWAYDKVRKGMLRVVEEGTAYYSRIEGFKYGGKTGTAQNPHGKDHSLFIAFAPYDDPTVAMAVIVENAGHGSSAAAPIASKIIKHFFNIQP